MNTALLFVFTVVSLSSFTAIFVGIDPYATTGFVRALFFITLFFSMIGVFSILSVWISKLSPRPYVLEVIFRRSILLATLAMSLIILETFSLLNIANAAAAFLFIVSLELLSVYKKT